MKGVVSLTLRLLYPGGKSPWYPLNRSLGGSPQTGWMFWRNLIPLLLPEFEPWIAGPTACCCMDWAVLLMTNRQELTHHVMCLNSCFYSSEKSGGLQANFILSEPVNGKDLCAWCASTAWPSIFLECWSCLACDASLLSLWLPTL